MNEDSRKAGTNEDRRRFLKKCCAGGIGAALTLAPLGAGMGVLLDPLRRHGGDGQAIRVATLDAVPADGLARSFPVVATRVDAWSTFPNEPVGTVYLRRAGNGTLQAFSATCPHAGCLVNYSPTSGTFHCPCHNSNFAADGSVMDKSSPAPRPLDALEVETRNGNEVWVKFQSFLTGRRQKVPAA
jgi:Rieske Fe-S protein